MYYYLEVDFGNNWNKRVQYFLKLWVEIRISGKKCRVLSCCYRYNLALRNISLSPAHSCWRALCLASLFCPLIRRSAPLNQLTSVGACNYWQWCPYVHFDNTVALWCFMNTPTDKCLGPTLVTGWLPDPRIVMIFGTAIDLGAWSLLIMDFNVHFTILYD